MAFQFRSLPVIVLPLLLLGALTLLLWQKDAPKPTPGADGTWLAMDLQVATAVDRIPGWDVRRGNYRLGELEGRKLLELLPEPIVEGKIISTRVMRGAAGVRARMRGEATRRAFPRFSVGLHQERELHLRAFPHERKLELVACNPDLTNESLLAAAPLPDWTWRAENWLWLELQIVPEVGGTARCEGRLWTDGARRPDSALLSHQLTLPPTVFFAALQGAPFALRPIFIDAAETLPEGGQSWR